MTTDDRVMRLFEQANPVPDPGEIAPKVSASSYLDTIERKSTTMTVTTIEPEAPEHHDAHPRRPWLLAAAAAAALLLVAGLIVIGARPDDDPVPADQPRPSTPAPTTLPDVETEAAAETVVDVAIANDFTTLLAAAEATGLVEVLRGDGPFTVFAPTDEAFAELPDGLLDALLREENRETLAAVLEYHVVPDTVHSSDLSTDLSGESVDEISVATLEGEDVMIVVDQLQRGPGAGDETGIGVGPLDRLQAGQQADVVTRDLEAGNGVVHAIDRVMVPPSIGPAVVLRDALVTTAAGD
jgi:uncharacterized surface protein with fasciclin (FAS1) repeats